MLLDLSVPERLADATAIGAKEVVSHVRVEVDVILLADKVPLLGSCLELLVVPCRDCLILQCGREKQVIMWHGYFSVFTN